MKITVEHYDTKITIEKDHDEQTLTEMCEIFEELLKGMSFHFSGHLDIVNEDEDYNSISSLLTEFFAMLEETEESDSGTEFHPVHINSCRVIKSKRLGEIFRELKEKIGYEFEAGIVN